MNVRWVKRQVLVILALLAIGVTAAFWFRPAVAAGPYSLPHTFLKGQVAPEINDTFLSLQAELRRLQAEIDKIENEGMKVK